MPLACYVILSGCTLLPIGEKVRHVIPSRVPSRPELVEIRAAFHVHSLLSHDSDGSFEEIAAAASNLGIQVVLLTDHYAPGNVRRSPRGVLGLVLFIPGLEMRRPGGGSLLAVGVSRDFDPGLDYSGILRELESQRAYLVEGHVESTGDVLPGERLEGFELYNLHAQFNAASPAMVILRFLFFPPDWFFETTIEPPEDSMNRFRREAVTGHRKTLMAGHDAHANIRFFGPLGGTIGTYPEVFRLFSTRILATDLSEEAILEALRRGRTNIVFDYLGEVSAESFRFEYEAPGNSTPPAIVGAEVQFERGQMIRVTAPPGAKIVLFRGDQRIYEGFSPVHLESPGSGVYQVEVTKDGKLWVVSGLIHVI